MEGRKMKKLLAILLAICCVLSLAACGSKTEEAPKTDAPADDATVYNVGIVQLVQHAALDAATKGFRDALVEAFGEDGVNFDEQNASGDSALCSTISTGFVTNEVDLIMANATPAVLAAIAATDTIPVLGTSVTDYGTALGYDLTNGATGINLSGTSDGVPAQAYVDCLLEVVPDAKNVSIVYCSAEPNSVKQADDFIAAMAATKADVVCTVYTFADSNDMQAVVTSAAEGADAFYIPTDNTAAANMNIVRNITEPANLVVVAGEEGMCAAGGAVTVSISYYNIGHVAGEMAAKILAEGADVSTMAIGYDNAPVKKFNAEYCTAIGLEVPAAYEAIEG